MKNRIESDVPTPEHPKVTNVALPNVEELLKAGERLMREKYNERNQEIEQYGKGFTSRLRRILGA